MCIVIDTNTLASVFKEDSELHDEFIPVKEWILNGKGKIVFGGSDYQAELKKYLSIFKELKVGNKAVYISSDLVDKKKEEIKKLIVNKNFDDPHIVALLMVSGCKLICSNDKRAFPYFTHKLFFHPSKNTPKIYSGKRNKRLLVDNNIASICKSC